MESSFASFRISFILFGFGVLQEQKCLLVLNPNTALKKFEQK